MMAVLMPKLTLLPIFIIGLLLWITLNQHGRKFLWATLGRMRWLWLSIVLIMAFNTPGEVLAFWTWYGAPTYEGLQQGGLQIARLALMLVLIALMTCALSMEQLLSAFYLLSKPLRYLGLSPQRLAIRLCLTIQYIHTHMKKRPDTRQSRQLLEEFIQQTSATNTDSQLEFDSLTIQQIQFSLLDYSLMGLMLLSIVMAWGQG